MKSYLFLIGSIATSQQMSGDMHRRLTADGPQEKLFELEHKAIISKSTAKPVSI